MGYLFLRSALQVRYLRSNEGRALTHVLSNTSRGASFQTSRSAFRTLWPIFTVLFRVLDSVASDPSDTTLLNILREVANSWPHNTAVNSRALWMEVRFEMHKLTGNFQPRTIAPLLLVCRDEQRLRDVCLSAFRAVQYHQLRLPMTWMRSPM